MFRPFPKYDNPLVFTEKDGDPFLEFFAGTAAEKAEGIESSDLASGSNFLIGAHADVRGYRLLSLDERVYRATFPALKIEVI